MRISHTHRFVFYSNPKTGSTTVRTLLDPYSDIAGVPKSQTSPDFPFHSHMRPVEVKKIFVERGWDYDDYYRFTFVRNPWSRLVSLYEMWMRKETVGKTRNLRIREILRPSWVESQRFAAWLDTIDVDGRGAAPKGNGARWLRFGTHTFANYVSDTDGNELVDEAIKLEEIDDALPAVLARLDIPLPPRIPKKNEGVQPRLSQVLQRCVARPCRRALCRRHRAVRVHVLIPPAETTHP